MSQIDIYIQPSLSEGLGISVIEAMLAKKPVIVTPVGALKEIVEDGKTGFIAKSTKPKAIADTMKRVFDDFGNIQEIIDKAEKEAKKNFSIKICVDETISAYLEVIN